MIAGGLIAVALTFAIAGRGGGGTGVSAEEAWAGGEVCASVASCEEQP